MNLLRPFLFPSIAALETVPSDAIASVVRWPGRRITLDGSAVLANALFLNLERDFDPNVPLEEMKATIINDETALLKLLDVEEVSA